MFSRNYLLIKGLFRIRLKEILIIQMKKNTPAIAVIISSVAKKRKK